MPTDNPRTVGLALLIVFLIVFVVATLAGSAIDYRRVARWLAPVVREMWWGFRHPGLAYRSASRVDRWMFVWAVAVMIGAFLVYVTF